MSQEMILPKSREGLEGSDDGTASFCRFEIKLKEKMRRIMGYKNLWFRFLYEEQIKLRPRPLSHREKRLAIERMPRKMTVFGHF